MYMYMYMHIIVLHISRYTCSVSQLKKNAVSTMYSSGQINVAVSVPFSSVCTA